MTKIRQGGAAPQQPEVRSLRARYTGKSGHEQRAQRRKRQCVGEMAMVLNREKRIRFAADENIGVRDESRETSDPSRGASQFSSEGGIAETGAQQRMCEWIHGCDRTDASGLPQPRSAMSSSAEVAATHRKDGSKTPSYASGDDARQWGAVFDPPLWAARLRAVRVRPSLLGCPGDHE